MQIPPHIHALPHVHIPNLHFIVPHTVGLPAWWWTGTFMLIPWTAIVVWSLWFYRHARKEEERRIMKIDELL